MRHGWLIIPGVQTGDRTLDEQMTGVREALPKCVGKTVLDIGCAEGLIGREFVRAGAARCHGIESVEDHLKVARSQCAGLPMTFLRDGLQEFAERTPDPERFDIVLALGVLHKIHVPEIGLRFAARSTKDLLLIRMHKRSDLGAGVIKAKHRPSQCSSVDILAEEGFTREKILPGPYEETVWYWRRI